MKHWLLIFAFIFHGEGLIAEERGASSAAGRRPSEAYANQTIVISGSVELQDYNPTTGKPHTNQHSRSSFVVMLSGDSWKCSVTNVDWPQWHAEFAYDGTNTYTILPFEKALFAPFRGDWNTNPPSTGLHFLAIEPSDLFLQRGVDNYGLFTVWLTYGLCPQRLKTNKLGLVDRPLSGARQHPGGFGYKWLVDASPDGRFANRCEVVRDKALDLDYTGEFFRRELDYPETRQQIKEYEQHLAGRRNTPTGYVKYRYTCTDWWRTNGFMIPAAASLELSISPRDGLLPWRVTKLKAANVTVRAGRQNLLLQIVAPTQVQDYRYKRANESHIFKYAEYWLKAGESWKPANDPKLVAEAEEWLRSGPEIER